MSQRGRNGGNFSSRPVNGGLAGISGTGKAGCSRPSTRGSAIPVREANLERQPEVVKSSSSSMPPLGNPTMRRLNTAPTGSGGTRDVHRRTPVTPSGPSSSGPSFVVPGLSSSEGSSNPSRPQMQARVSTSQGRRPPSQGSPGMGNASSQPSTPLTSSGQQQQQNFHKGLVNALQDVLRKQRQGIFPQPPDASQANSSPGPARPMTSQIPTRSSPTPGAPPLARPSTSGMDPSSIDDAIRRKKTEWAHRHWNKMQRQDRLNREATLASNGRQGRMSPSIHLSEGDVMGAEMLPSAQLIADIENLIRNETGQRRGIEQTQRQARDQFLVLLMKEGDEVAKGMETPAFESSPATAAELKVQGNELYEQRMFIEAHRKYSQAVEADPSNPVLLTNRAATSMMLMNYDACVRDCAKAVTVESTLWKGFARMAHAYALMGELVSAAKHYSSAIFYLEKCVRNSSMDNAATPAAHAALTRLSEEQASLQKLDKAKRELERGNYAGALSILNSTTCFLDDPPIRLMQLQALTIVDPIAARGDLSKYIAAFDHPNTYSSNVSAAALASNLTAHYSELLLLAAKASFYCGQQYLNIANAYVKQTLAIVPDHRGAQGMRRTLSTVESRLTDARLFIEKQQFQDAFNSFSAALNADPKNSKLRCVLLINRADAAFRMSQHESVVADCGSVLEVEPKNVRALARRSESHEALGDDRLAVQDMELAYAINKDYESDLVELKLRVRQRHMERGQGSARGYPSGSSGEESGSDADYGYGYGSKFHRRRSSSNHQQQRTLYDILGVPRHSDNSTIRSQYRKLTLQYHPDKVVKESDAVKQQCEVRFKEISHAYSVLADAQSRHQYDLLNPL